MWKIFLTTYFLGLFQTQIFIKEFFMKIVQTLPDFLWCNLQETNCNMKIEKIYKGTVLLLNNFIQKFNCWCMFLDILTFYLIILMMVLYCIVLRIILNQRNFVFLFSLSILKLFVPYLISLLSINIWLKEKIYFNNYIKIFTCFTI